MLLQFLPLCTCNEFLASGTLRSVYFCLVKLALMLFKKSFNLFPTPSPIMFGLLLVASFSASLRGEVLFGTVLRGQFSMWGATFICVSYLCQATSVNSPSRLKTLSTETFFICRIDKRISSFSCLTTYFSYFISLSRNANMMLNSPER